MRVTTYSITQTNLMNNIHFLQFLQRTQNIYTKILRKDYNIYSSKICGTAIHGQTNSILICIVLVNNIKVL